MDPKPSGFDAIRYPPDAVDLIADEPEWLDAAGYTPDHIYNLCEQWAENWIDLANCILEDTQQSAALGFSESLELLATVAELEHIDAAPLLTLQRRVDGVVYHRQWPIRLQEGEFEAARYVVDRLRVKAQAGIAKRRAAIQRQSQRPRATPRTR